MEGNVCSRVCPLQNAHSGFLSAALWGRNFFLKEQPGARSVDINICVYVLFCSVRKGEIQNHSYYKAHGYVFRHEFTKMYLYNDTSSFL